MSKLLSKEEAMQKFGISAIVGILTGVSMNKSSANNPKHIDNHS